MFGGSPRAYGRGLLKSWHSRSDKLCFWVIMSNHASVCHSSGLTTSTFLFRCVMKEQRIGNMSPEGWVLTAVW